MRDHTHILGRAILAIACCLAAAALVSPATAATRRGESVARWVVTRPLYSVDFVSAKQGWVGGGGGSILRTTNAGKTWKVQRRYSSSGPDLLDTAFVSRSRGWVVGTTGFISRTTDGGAHWRRQGSGLMTENIESVRFLSANRGFACGGFASFFMDDAHSPFGSILRTTNGGRTWKKKNFTGFCPRAIDFTGTASGVAVGLLRHQTDPSTGYNTVAMTQTSDGGVTWSAPTEIVNTPTVVGTAMGIDLRGTSCAIVGSDWSTDPSLAFALFSNDGMASWSPVTLPPWVFYDVKVTSATTAYVTGLTSQVWKTTDSGVGWAPHDLPSAGRVEDLDFVSSSTGYVVGQWGPSDFGGRVYKTANGGTTWTRKR